MKKAKVNHAPRKDTLYKPTAYDFNGAIVPQLDIFDPPAPTFGYSNIGLSIFNGAAPNGVYSLFVQDFVSGDDGTIAQGWELEISTTPVPEPTTLSLMGIGILGMMSRSCISKIRHRLHTK